MQSFQEPRKEKQKQNGILKRVCYWLYEMIVNKRGCEDKFKEQEKARRDD